MGRRSPSGYILRTGATVLYNHPFLTGLVILMFTPPFFPLVVYFSPLLISTALCVAALVSLGSQMEKIEAEGEGTLLDVHLGRERGIGAWVERERPDRENVVTHFSAERDLPGWVSRTEPEAMYGEVEVSSWTGADVDPTRTWVGPAQERAIEREIEVEPQAETDEDRWNAWVKEYEARPGWGETEDNEPVAVVTATTKPASISKPNEENLPHKEEATSLPKPENTHRPVTQIPIRKVETVGIQHDKQKSIKEGVTCSSQSHVSDVQALDSIEKLLYQEMGAPKVQPIVSLPKSDVPAEVLVHLKTAGLGSISNMQARRLSHNETLPGEAAPAGASGAGVQRVQAAEKNRNKVVEAYDIGAETPLLRHLKTSRTERRGRIVEYSPLPLRSLMSVGSDRNLTTSERSPRLLQKSKNAGSKSSGKNLAQFAYGGFAESGRTQKPLITSEFSPRLLQNSKTAGLGSSDESENQGAYGGLRESSTHRMPVQVSRVQGGGGEKSVTTSESAPLALLKSVGTRSSGERISQDGYGGYTESSDHRMPVPMSRVQRDGLENTGAISEFSPQMVLETAGIRNPEETISQDGYGGCKENNELRMPVQVRTPVRDDVEKIVATPKCSPCLSQKLNTSGSKDNNPQGGYDGAREVNDPKMPAETNRPERIGLEKTVTASEYSPRILPRLKAAGSETSKEKVSKEAVELNVSNEVNRLETCEKKHVMDVKNPEPEVKISTPSRRRSHVNRQIILEGEFQQSRSHQSIAGPVEVVPSSATDVTGSLTQDGSLNAGLSLSSVYVPQSRRRSYPRRQLASEGANSHRRIELSTDLQHPSPSETVVTGPKDYISIEQGGGISECNRLSDRLAEEPSDTVCKLSEVVPVQAEANSANRLSARHSRRRIEPRRVSCPDGEMFCLQKSLTLRDAERSRHTDSSSDDREFITPRTERRWIKRTTKPLVWRSRSTQTQDDSD